MQGVSAQDDIFLLNKFSKYGKEKERIVINYDHDSRLVEKLKSTYNDFPQNEASEFRTLVNIRKWVNKYLYFQNVSFLEEFRESNWNTLFVLELMKKKQMNWMFIKIYTVDRFGQQKRKLEAV